MSDISPPEEKSSPNDSASRRRGMGAAAATPPRVAGDGSESAHKGHSSSDSDSRSEGSGGGAGSRSRLRGSPGEGSEFRFVDNYGLLLCLGEGGMGEVWAARDPNAPKNRVVALKTTKQHGAEAAKVLWDEARIASLIDHPHVCQVQELGQFEGMQYLVMDYCDGASLHDLLERSPERVLPCDLAARILADVCAGLHAAHELVDENGQHLGVVHRDVSPQNILISTTGHVTVTDFGVAKALGQAHKATETGEMKGKLSYMAPEQITTRDIDRRADVFALGCVLYHITVGKRPFHGEDALATLYQLLEKDLVRPSELLPGYPEELERIVLKALEKDRARRYETAEQLQRALEHFLLSSERPLFEKDIGDALMNVLGSQIRERKDRIKRRVAALDTGGAPSEPRLRATESGTNPEHDTAAGTVTNPPPREASSLRPRLLAAAVFLGIAFATLLVLRERGGDGGASPPVAAPELAVRAAPDVPTARDVEAELEPPDSVAAPSGKEASSTSGEPTPVIEVTLAVKASPAGARILLDGEQVGVGQFETKAARSTAGHLLEISAPGYEKLTRALVFDRDQNLELSLRRATQTPSVVKPSSTPTRGAAPPGPSGSKSTKKPPRALDSENPFATSP